MPKMSDILKGGFQKLAVSTASPQSGIEGGKKIVKEVRVALGAPDENLNLKQSMDFISNNPDMFIPGSVSSRQIAKAIIKSTPTNFRKMMVKPAKEFAKMIPEETKLAIRSIGRARHSFKGKSKHINRLNKHRTAKGQKITKLGMRDLGVNMTAKVTSKKGVENLLKGVSPQDLKALLSGRVPHDVISQQMQLTIINALTPQAKLGANDIAIIGKGQFNRLTPADNLRVGAHEIVHGGTVNKVADNPKILDKYNEHIFNNSPVETVVDNPVEAMAEIGSHNFMKRLVQDNPELVGKFDVIPGLDEFATTELFDDILNVMRSK